VLLLRDGSRIVIDDGAELSSKEISQVVVRVHSARVYSAASRNRNDQDTKCSDARPSQCHFSEDLAKVKLHGAWT
jgi:hypothetical protein